MALIGLRLIAIYLIAQGISNIPSVYMLLSSYNQQMDNATTLYGSVTVAIFSPMLVGVLLWFISPKISNHLTPSINDELNNNKIIDIQELQTTAIILIGVYLLASTLPYVISINYQLFTNMDKVDSANTFNLSILFNALSVNIKLLLAILLIIGSNSINSFIMKIRTSGTN